MKINQLSQRQIKFFVLFSIIAIITTFQCVKPIDSPTAQIGSTINGMVFGPDKRGLSDVDIELLDELSRLISRTRTGGGGRFVFRNLSSGNYIVRVMPGRFGYDEQSKGVEIASFSRGAIAGASNETQFLDFYLQSSKPISLAQSAGITNVIFVQDVPIAATKLYKQAISDFENGKAEAAAENLKKSIEIFPDYYLALDLLGEHYIKQQDFKTAQEVLERAVKVNQKGASSFYLLGYAQYTAKQYKAAIQSLREAITWSPKSANSHLYLGMALRQIAKYEDAEAQMKKAKELAKKRLPEVYYQLALLYTNNLKKYNEAADELEQYLKLGAVSNDAEPIKKLIKQLREKAAKQTS
jgi:tetratricopeptide (TPR) repeat protein